MVRKLLMTGMMSASFVLAAAAADNAPARGNLTAAQIVERNVAARGGLQAWRAVTTVSESGKLGAGGDQRQPVPVATALPKRSGKAPEMQSSPRLKEEAQLPFVMEMKRPRKQHFELQFNGQTALQVYDGTNGWKLRPFLNRREVEPFTADELKMASMQADLDGPLVDYAAKGTRVELAGTEKVEGRDTYKLNLTLKNGQTTHVWVDAQTFLESKIEGQPRRLDGKLHPVEIYYRDFRSVDGLQFPFELDTKVLPVDGPKERAIPVEKIIIDKIVVNPKLDDTHFSKSSVEVAANHHS